MHNQTKKLSPPDIIRGLRAIREQGQCDCHICDITWQAADLIQDLQKACASFAAWVDHHPACETMKRNGPCTCGLARAARLWATLSDKEARRG